MNLKLDFNERADSVPLWLQEFRPDTQCLWQYPDRSKIEAKIAEKFNLTVENIFLSNGGDESIELLFKSCQLNNQSILLSNPAFSQYTHQLSIWNIDSIVVDGLPNLAIDVDQLKKQLKANQWLVITRPNNPTGECLSESILLDLIKAAQNKGANIFLDEAYVEFYTENSEINYAKEFENVISLRTFSKAFGLAGARIGYLMGNASLIAEFKKLSMPFNVNQMSLQLAQKALDNIGEMNDYCASIAKNRDEIFTLLQSFSVDVFNGKGNFLLFRVGNKRKQLLKSYLLKNKIQIKTQVDGLPDCVRITIPAHTEKLKKALQTVFKPDILAFDMDGVLIDTSRSYDASIIKTVEFFTKKIINVEEITELREKGGFNNDWDLTQKLIERNGFTVWSTNVINKFQEYYNQFKNNETNLLNQSTAIEIFDRDGITAIITGRPKIEANSGVKQLNIQPNFIISADDVEQQKPSPEGINWLKTETGKNNMWFCGDTVDDMQAGTAANCICIGIGDNAENLYRAGADIVLNNINEIKELL
ncbi:MAG: aminotransferase class I/II-fold pyridoxal phosphate-dependent enzyme [Marinicellaceae bacterium]